MINISIPIPCRVPAPGRWLRLLDADAALASLGVWTTSGWRGYANTNPVQLLPGSVVAMGIDGKYELCVTLPDGTFHVTATGTVVATLALVARQLLALEPLERLRKVTEEIIAACACTPCNECDRCEQIYTMRRELGVQSKLTENFLATAIGTAPVPAAEPWPHATEQDQHAVEEKENTATYSCTFCGRPLDAGGRCGSCDGFALGTKPMAAGLDRKTEAEMRAELHFLRGTLRTLRGMAPTVTMATTIDRALSDNHLQNYVESVDETNAVNAALVAAAKLQWSGRHPDGRICSAMEAAEAQRQALLLAAPEWLNDPRNQG